MKKNTEVIDGSIEVYTDKIYQYADEYISNLDNENDIYTSSVFTGMLKYIYNNLFKPDRKMHYNAYTNLDINNIYLLDNIWSIYTQLAYKYKKRPTILNYCILIGLDMNTINNWYTGKSRNSNLEYFRTTKRWYSECESALLDGAIENNSVGCIFALKANYGYRETAPAPAEVISGPTQTPEEIAQKHVNAQLPEMPVFTEDTDKE